MRFDDDWECVATIGSETFDDHDIDRLELSRARIALETFRGLLGNDRVAVSA